MSYNVLPKLNLPTGTVIRNKATIDFEVGIPPASMDTPEVINTIDSDMPTSHVLSLANPRHFTSFVVQWAGTDNGSGVGGYTIYVSDNDGPYTPWLANVTSTSAIFDGLAGHTYRFFSRARDRVGNFEPLALVEEATATTPHVVYLPSVYKNP